MPTKDEIRKVRRYQDGLRKKLKDFHEKGGPPLEQEEISVLVDQFQMDQFRAAERQKRRRKAK